MAGALAGAADENLAHEITGYLEEVRGVAGMDHVLALKFDIQVIDQGCGTGAVGLRFRVQKAGGHTVQVAVNKFDEPVESRAVTLVQPAGKDVHQTRFQLMSPHIDSVACAFFSPAGEVLP